MKYSVSYSRKVRVAEFDMLEVSLVQEFDDSLTPRESGFMTVRDFVEERTREETKRLLAERVSGLEPAKTEAASIIHKPSVPITVETVTEKFPQNLKGLLYFQDAGEAILIKPRQYLGTEDFKAISEIVRDQLNGEYISAGKESHFRIPKGKAEATASKPEPPRTIGFIDETPKIPSFDPRTLTDHEWKNKKLAEGSYTKGSLSWGWDFADQFPEFVIQVLRKEPLEIDRYVFSLDEAQKIVQTRKREAEK